MSIFEDIDQLIQAHQDEPDEHKKYPYAYQSFDTKLFGSQADQVSARTQKMWGGFYGAIIGDAQGVPYEFRSREELAGVNVDIIPPEGWVSSFYGIPHGTYSDDTSLMLCLLDSVTQDAYFLDVFKRNMIDWQSTGKFAVRNKVFDIGIATLRAIELLKEGKDVKPNAQLLSNGSLMRTLPIAFKVKPEVDWAEQIHRYMSHVNVTNPNALSVAVCMLYTTIAFLMLNYDADPHSALKQALDTTADWVGREAVETIVGYDRTHTPTGSGYVVDAFWSAFYALINTNNFDECVRYAIKYGKDTDTTACIAGGLAGIKYGYDNLPSFSVDLINQSTDMVLYQEMLNKLI